MTGITPAYPVLVSDSGPDYQTTYLTPVATTIAAPGTTSSLAIKSGRAFYLVLSGGTSAAGYIEVSDDGGTTWAQYKVDGVQLYTFNYVAATSNDFCAFAGIELYGTVVRARFTAVSGTVTYRLKQ